MLTGANYGHMMKNLNTLTGNTSSLTDSSAIIL